MPKGNPGVPKTEEHRRHLSLACLGRLGYWTGKKMPESARAAMRGHRRPLLPEHKEKISNSLKELLKDPEQRAARATWTGRHHTSDELKKMSIAQQGANGSGWKGGVSPINERIRQSSEFKRWRAAVFARDNYTCRSCGGKHQVGSRPKLHPHHIKKFADYPELRFDVDNGITLCETCHREVHS